MREDPTVAATLLSFPWLADGVTREERNAAYSLREILRQDPAIAETILGFPWLADGVTSDESNVVYYLRLILQGNPAAAESLLGSPWLADGVTRAEERTLWGLWVPYRLDRYGLSALNTKPWFRDGLSDEELELIGYLISIANRDADAAAALVNIPWIQDDITETEADALKYLSWISSKNTEAAAALIAMPFLESVESRDTLALKSLSEIAGRDANGFGELMSHPRIKDGITDEETKIVAVLGGSTSRYAVPGAAQALLAETGVYIEERLIELPHTGETLLAVIRTEDKVTPSMDYLEHAVRTIEEFMGVPYPIDYFALLFYDREFGASNSYSHLLMMPEFDLVDGPDWHAGVIAHETAHWYWRNDGDRFQYQHWIVEGGADFLRVISQHERIGRPLEPIGRPCRYFDNISELEKANPGRSNPASECENSLGQGLLLDLYFALGDETFRAAYRTLYLRHKQASPADGCGGPRLNICRLEAAFKDGASEEVVRKVEEIIARWYGSRP